MHFSKQNIRKRPPSLLHRSGNAELKGRTEYFCLTPITAAHCFFIHIFLFFARLHHTRNTGLSVPSKHLRRNKGAVMPTKTISTLQNIFFHKKTGLSNSPDQNTNPQSPAMPPFHDNATMPAPPIKTTAAAENRNGRIKREYAPPFSGEGQDAGSDSGTGPDLHA